MTTLPNEDEQRIEQEATHYANVEIGDIAKINDSLTAAKWVSCKVDYTAGAIAYATQVNTLQQENEKLTKKLMDAYTEVGRLVAERDKENADLKRRLAECETLLTPLLEYGQSKEAGFPLGSSVTEGILTRAKESERLRRALEKINTWCKGCGLKEVAIDNMLHMAIYHSLHESNAALTAQPEGDNQQK